MVLRFFLLAGTFFLLSCVSIERENPDDPRSNNYKGLKNSSSSGGILGPSVTYDGETYQTVVIGKQIWFKRNLNYEAESSKCYNDDPANCTIYGRLYDRTTAMTVCPDGWHLPSDDEWTALTDYVGGSAGIKLKATSGWDYSGNGTDDFGFSALPGGSGFSSDFSYFYNLGHLGYWWSATDTTDFDFYGTAIYYRYYRDMRYDNDVVIRFQDAPFNEYLYSVRCLQN